MTSVFNQYLRFKNIPILEIKQGKKRLEYRWKTDEPNFEMPIDIQVNAKTIRLQASNTWQKIKIKLNTVENVTVLTDSFYVTVSKD